MLKTVVAAFLFFTCTLRAESVSSPSPSTLSEQNPYAWDGLHLKGYVGSTIEYLKPPKQATPLAGFALEYSWVFDKFFCSVEGAWLYYPQMFKESAFSVAPIFGDWTIPNWALYFLPITGLHVGYITDSNDLFTIGLAYFWGITGSYRHPIDENLAFEARATWFYDRVLYGDGLHDMHVVVGINYRF